MPNDVCSCRKVFLSIGRVRRSNKTVHPLRRRFHFAKRRHQCQFESHAPFLWSRLPRQSYVFKCQNEANVRANQFNHFFPRFLYNFVERGQEYPDNSGTSHLFSGGRRPDTAFQRYRNSRLGGEFHSEITGRSLSECLDECLRQTSFQCRSAVYSDRFRTCRLSRYNQKDGMRIIYDADYDYYENLMCTYAVFRLYYMPSNWWLNCKLWIL